MKKPDFEDELLLALRDQLKGPPQAAARVRVSRRLEATFVGLDLGLANLASLPSSAPVLKAAAVKASAAKAAGVQLGAAKTLAAAAPALSMSTHPIATLIATFAVGAAAGTGIMVASEGVPTISRAPTAQSARAHTPPPHAPRHHTSVPRASHPAPVELSAPIAESAPSPPLAVAGSEHKPERPSERRPERSSAAPPVPSSNPPVVSSKKPPGAIARATSSRPPTASMADALGAQQSLLDRAREALAHGDGASALSSLAEHERAFASTLLEEERLSLKIKSLVASERIPEARALAADFAARFPHSLLLPSIQAVVSKNP